MKVLNKLDSLDNINDGETRKLPTKTSQLTNDSGYITSANVPTKVSELQNDSNFITNTGSTSGNAGTATTLQTYTYSRNNSTNTWFKVATTTMPKTSTYGERHAFLFIKGSHNSNYNQNGIIAIDAVGNSNKGKIGSYNAQFMSATQDLNLENFYIEYLNGDSETDGIVNFWIRANTNGYASWQVKILQNSGWTIASSGATAASMPSTEYTGKNAILAGSATDVQIDGVSITSSGVANINTTGYDASTNFLATVNDINNIGSAKLDKQLTLGNSITTIDNTGAQISIESTNSNSSTQSRVYVGSNGEIDITVDGDDGQIYIDGETVYITSVAEPTSDGDAANKKYVDDSIYNILADNYLTSGKTYNSGDIVSYDLKLYMCINDDVSGSWDSADWQQITIKDLFGDTHKIYTITGDLPISLSYVLDYIRNYYIPNVIAEYYNYNSTYNVGDYVMYEDGLWVCTTNISTPEQWNSSHWSMTSMTSIIGNIESLLGGI